MAARIAEFLFPASQHRSQDVAYSAYTARVKLMYHKQVLVPLRACLDVPEVTCNYTHACNTALLLHSPFAAWQSVLPAIAAAFAASVSGCIHIHYDIHMSLWIWHAYSVVILQPWQVPLQLLAKKCYK